MEPFAARANVGQATGIGLGFFTFSRFLMWRDLDTAAWSDAGQLIENVLLAAHDGKSVLFVAEKAAALDVVHGRLKSVGLEPLCLEIHSKKATRLSVVSSLERAMGATGTAQADGRNARDLRVARDLLNGWSVTLHHEIHHSGRTPFQIMGKVIKLRTDGVRVFEQRLDVAEGWDRDRLQAAEKVGDELKRTLWLRLGLIHMVPF